MTDWNNAIEANAALDLGELPPGYTLRDGGALIVPSPDRADVAPVRGHSSIMDGSDTVVAADGTVLKSKTGEAL